MLAFNFSTFLITIINVGILFLVLRKVLFKPVTAFMEGRTGKIQQQIEEAGKDREAAKALLAEYRGRLDKAEEEAARVIEAARTSARKEADRIIAEGKEAAGALMSEARKQIALEESAAWADFRKEAAVLVASAAGKLAARDFSREDDRHYAESLLGALEAPSGEAHGA